MTVTPTQAFLYPAAIRAHLDDAIVRHLTSLEVAPVLPSTNQALLDAPIAPGELWVCIAEHQTAGRGRRSRSWIAPPRSGLCMSIGYGFTKTPANLAALTLAMGVCAAEVLARAGAGAVQLKWPNDLISGARKLGGILTEVGGDAHAEPIVVVGLGVNLALPPAGLALGESQAAPPIDLASLCAVVPTPSVLAGALVDAMGAALLHYGDTGFEPFGARFAALDALMGQAVEFDGAGGKQRGVAAGITGDGSLRVRTGSGDTTVMAGDVSLVRPAP